MDKKTKELTTPPPASQERGGLPAECSGDPLSCPENEGFGCYCASPPSSAAEGPKVHTEQCDDVNFNLPHGSTAICVCAAEQAKPDELMKCICPPDAGCTNKCDRGQFPAYVGFDDDLEARTSVVPLSEELEIEAALLTNPYKAKQLREAAAIVRSAEQAKPDEDISKLRIGGHPLRRGVGLSEIGAGCVLAEGWYHFRKGEDGSQDDYDIYDAASNPSRPCPDCVRVQIVAAETSSAEQAQAGELPPLPEPTRCHSYSCCHRNVYTADQMRDYANACRLAGGVTVDVPELRKVAKRNLRSLIERSGDSEKELMLKCLEELS